MEPVLENTQVGPFLILRRLGKNRRQRVFHARQTEQGRDVALKFIALPEKVAWEKALEKVQREVAELKQLRHENLAKVYGAGVHDEQVFFASELVKGEALSDILTRRGRLTTDLVVEYGRQIAEILRYLHSVKLVHGQLTPKKLMVTSDHKIKLIDLRLCRSGRRRWDVPKRPQPEIAAYMAPEQFMDGPSERSDFYALGVILYEMTAGQLPVEPDTIGRMIRAKRDSPSPSVAASVMACPVWLDKMITQLLQPVAKQRPYSAKALVLTFDEIKKVDASKGGATSQIAGNFNPLTAGRDKTEARDLLSKKRSKREELQEPFYQTIPFLVAALMLTAFAGIWFALPPSAGDLVHRGRVLIESASPSDWETAARSMERVIERKSKYANEAQEIYDTAKRKTLVDLAKRGMKNRSFHAPVTRDFVDAYKFEQNEQPEKAKALYFQIIGNTDPQGDKRHVYLESQARYRAITEKIVLPETAEQLTIVVERTKRARTPQEIELAKKILAKIYVEKSGDEGFEQVTASAKEQLDRLNALPTTTTEAPPKADDATNDNENGNDSADERDSESSSSQGAASTQPPARPSE